MKTEMNRNERIWLAQETLVIHEGGTYESANGKSVSIADQLRRCIETTEYFLPEELEAIVANLSTSEAADNNPDKIVVVNETTLEGASKLVQSGNYQRIGVLNFASAKNPGGGFLGGSQAQEESLARSSGLYASIKPCEDYYSVHRSMKSCLYTDRIIYSPACPVFMDDSGELLDEPYLVDFITCPAPNAGAVRKNTPNDIDQISRVFEARIEKVLALCADKNCDALVLGAWGCGVFRNDPMMVADLFNDLLGSNGRYRDHFSKILFSVLDRTEGKEIFSAFSQIQ